MIRSFHLSLVRPDCDAVTTPFNDTIQYSSTLLKVCVFPNHLLLDVLSSPCTVATIRSPLMQPSHTQGHAIPLVNLRSLSADASSSSQYCATTRVPCKLERRSTPFASQPVPPLFLHVYRGDLRQYCIQRLRRRRRVQLWPCVRLDFLRGPPRAHVGLPWLSLVSLRPVLMGAFSVSRRHSLGTLAYILWQMYSTSRPLAYSSRASHPPLLSQVTPFPRAEQFLLIVVHEFHHFILHVTCSFVFMNSPAYPLCIFCFLVLSQLFLHWSSNLMYPCSCLFHFLACVVCTNTSTTMRARAFSLHPHSNFSRIGDSPCTCVDKSRSSFITCGQPKHVQIHHYGSRSQHGHDFRHELHSRIHF